MRRLGPLVVLGCVACTTSLSLPDEVQVSCAEGQACPEGFVCSELVDRCVEVGTADSEPPGIVEGSVRVEPGVASLDTEVVVSFEVTEPLEFPPEVALAVAGRPKLLLLGRRGERYAFSYTPHGSEPQTTAALTATMVDTSGNLAGDVAVGNVLFDFRPPSVTGVRALGSTRLARGSRGSVEVTVDEQGADPPRVTLAETGRELDPDPGSEPPVYRFSFSVGEGDAEGEHGVTVLATDRAGNTTEETEPGLFEFDFTPPRTVGRPELLNLRARPGTVVGVSFEVSEELLEEPVLQLTSRDGASTLELVRGPQVGLRYTYTAEVPADARGEYPVTLYSYRDLAGNPGRKWTSSSAFTIDSTPPGLVGRAELDKESGFYRRGEHIEVRFSVDEDLGDDLPRVALSTREPEALPCVEGDAESYVCRLGEALDGLEEPQGLVGVSMQLTDIAGNVTTESTTVTLDFGLPAARECTLTPRFSSAAATISYAVTADEPLSGIELDVQGALDELFSEPPTPSPGGLAYTWRQPATGLQDQQYAVRARLTDLAGNESDGFVCQEEGRIDATAPELLTVGTWTDPEVRDASGGIVLAVGDGRTLGLDLRLAEAQELAEGGPQVVLEAPVAVPLAPAEACRREEGEADVWACPFELPVTLAEHEPAEGSWPLRAVLEDAAGNRTLVPALGDALVRVDFSPPEAECSLVPPPGEDPYPAGQRILLQVLPLELVPAEPLPELGELFEPAFDPARSYFRYEPGEGGDTSVVRFAATVGEGDGDRLFSLRLVLEDLVGNRTEAAGSACRGGVLSGAVDGSAPGVVWGPVQVGPPGEERAVSGPLRAGRRVSATLEVHGASSEQAPVVRVGGGALVTVPGWPVELDGAWEWRVARTLDGLEAEGERPVTAEGTDAAGNRYESSAPDPLVLDFSPPRARCQLSPEQARVGDLVRLVVTTNEPLAGGRPTVGVAGDALAFEAPEPDPEATRFVFEHEVRAGEPDLEVYAVHLELADVAGNPSPPELRCEGDVLQGSVDAHPLVVSDLDLTACFPRPVADGPGEAWTDTGHHAQGDSLLEVTFGLDEAPADGPWVLLGAQVVADADGCKPKEPAPSYLCVFPLPEDLPEAPADVSVEVEDAAGNRTRAVDPERLLVDYRPPALSGSPTLRRADGHLRAEAPGYGSVAARTGDEVRVSFSVNEPTSRPPWIELEGELTEVPDAEDEATSFSFLVTAGAAEGEQALSVRVFDLAGNDASLPLGLIDHDTQAPGGVPLERQALVRLYRAPWGSAATAGEARILVQGCPGDDLDFCPEEAEAAVEPLSLVRVHRTTAASGEVECTDTVLGEAEADGAGGFSVELLGDRAAVCLSQEDRAGNRGPRSEVSMVRWVGTLGGKIAGDDAENPHDLLRAVPFDPHLPMLGAETQPMESQARLNAAGSLDGEAAVLSASEGAWRQMGAKDVRPRAVSGAGAVFVGSRGEWLQFGGRESSRKSNETWIWNGQHWRQACTGAACVEGSPPRRDSQRMVYDPVTDKVWLWGGSDEQHDYLDDLWTWDGVAWREVDQGPVRPHARCCHALGFDSERQRLVLFGGSRTNPDQKLGDTWEFDGTRWEEVCTEAPCSSTRPAARPHPGMVYAPDRGQLLLVGGAGPTWKSGFNDMWAWDGEAWTLVCAPCLDAHVNYRGNEHSGLILPSVAYDTDRGVLVVHGGYNIYCSDRHHNASACHDLTYEWDGVNLWGGLPFRRIAPPGDCYDGGCGGHGCVFLFDCDWPGRRGGAALAYDPLRGQTVLFGGSNGDNGGILYDDTFVWDGTDWDRVCTDGDCLDDVFPPRSNHGHGYDPTRQRSVLYSGGDDRRTDVWAWDGAVWEELCTEEPCASSMPAEGSWHSKLVWDAANAHFLIWNADLAGTGVWSWDGGDGVWERRPGNLPSRWGASVVYDSVLGEAVVFGGSAGLWQQHNDTWTWSGTWNPDTGAWEAESWVNEGPPAPVPEARVHASYAFDPVREVMTLFGGYVYNNPPPGNNVWTWDGASWTALCDADCQAAGPSRHSSGAAIWHPSRETVVAFGGTNDRGLRTSDFWEWDGAAWREICDTDICRAGPPSPRTYFGMTWDGARRRAVVFGGTDGEPLGDTWEWETWTSRPHQVVAFDLRRARTVEPNGADPQTKVLQRMTVRAAAGGTTTAEAGELPGARLYTGVFGVGPWAPLWESREAGIADTATANGGAGLVYDPSWSCEDTPAFEPAEDPAGTGSRAYCGQARLADWLAADGKVYLLLTTRAGNGPGEAQVHLDYSELGVDYVRTGCSAQTEDGTPCATGDDEAPRGVCRAGACQTMAEYCAEVGDWAPCGAREDVELVCRAGACIDPADSPCAGGEGDGCVSCAEIERFHPDLPSGVYTIDPAGGDPEDAFDVWCELEADDGGWTLAMKLDGGQPTFLYDSALWTTAGTHRPEDATHEIPQMKSRPNAELGLSAHRQGKQEADGPLRTLVLEHRAGSLLEVFQGGGLVPTALGRDAWRSLLADGSLQPHCNEEGFNAGRPGDYARVRIGIVGNNEDQCDSPDSRIGFGGAGIGCGQDGTNACGNEAFCSADRGDRHTQAFGFVFVR